MHFGYTKMRARQTKPLQTTGLFVKTIQ